ncbi:MAG: DUF615 domain-containing protein [Myxococcales bacterium]|nr:DUF615 domain-containing protein [Myxococcales bacterium]
MRDDDDKPEPTRRQLARKQRRDAGDLSGDLARTLMTIKDAALAKLRLDEDIAEIVARARKVTSPVARRRAERSLAGELRRFELEEIAARISSEQDRASEEPRLFHAAEQLRAKLIESDAAIAEVPGGATDELTKLVANARRERETKKPPGAARALFRHVRALLERSEAAAAAEED